MSCTFCFPLHPFSSTHDYFVFLAMSIFSYDRAATVCETARGLYNGREFVFLLFDCSCPHDRETDHSSWSSVEGSSARVSCACFDFQIPRRIFGFVVGQ
jgi:hypothetical protein